METVRQQIRITRVGKTRKPAEVEPVDPPFTHVEHAVRTAYRMESAQVLDISSFFADLRASEIRAMSYYDNPWDLHAQAAMVLRYVKDNSTFADVLEAHHRQPHDACQLGKKWIACWKVTQRYIFPHDTCCVYAVADWGGLRLPKDWVKSIAKHMNVSVRQVYRIRKRVYEELDQLETRALAQLEDPMREAGLIP